MKKDKKVCQKDNLERTVIGYALQYTFACNEYRDSKRDVYRFPSYYPIQLLKLFRATDKLREVFNDTKRRKKAEALVIKTSIEYVCFSDEPDNKKEDFSGVYELLDVAEYELFNAVKRLIKQNNNFNGQ